MQYRGIQSHKCLQQMSKCDGGTVRLKQWHRFSPNFPSHDSDFLCTRKVVEQSRKPLRESVIIIDLTLILSGPGYLRRFPNPVPPGTAVPQWALVAISVRSSVGASPLRQNKPNPSPQGNTLWDQSAAQYVGGKQ